MSDAVNIASRLSVMANKYPDQNAVIQALKTHKNGETTYRRLTFQELDDQSSRIAAGLLQRGFQPGMKLVLFVPFSIEFITLTFALFKAGAVIVLIDPGMGRTNIFRCLEEVNPDGFVAVPLVQMIRLINSKKFPNAKFNISSKFWTPGVIGRLKDLKSSTSENFKTFPSKRDDLAAVIFTSGSTGPPKGVAYEHGMFDAQVEMIQSYYGIEEGEIDLPGFPMFGLFNAAMGVTTVIPEMDPTKPATVDPEKIIRDIRNQNVTQAFGSPAFWNRVGRYCVEHHVTFPSLNRALSAGGPVPLHVVEKMQKILTKEGADIFTPYGATESLPVASIAGGDVLHKTAEQTRQGAGTCVGKCFPGVNVKIIQITDGAIDSLEEAVELPAGEIGEIIVSSPSVTREYFQRPEPTRLSKITDGDQFWHRIGDVGYFDEDQNIWFCGRKAHIVEVESERLFSVRCEAIFNEHPDIYRSALVGIGEKPNQRPAIVVEPEADRFPATNVDKEKLISELLTLGQANSMTEKIQDVILHRSLPVDTRHNVKINREALAIWAKENLDKS